MKKFTITYIIIAIISGAIIGLLVMYINGLKITNRVDTNTKNIESIVNYINKNIVPNQTNNTQNNPVQNNPIQNNQQTIPQDINGVEVNQ